MSNKLSFKRPPLTQEEKEKKEREFLSFDKGQQQEIEPKRAGKEPTKTLYLRAPESYWNDIQEIMNITGLSMNAVCLELLRPAIRKKLREIKEE